MESQEEFLAFVKDLKGPFCRVVLSIAIVLFFVGLMEKAHAKKQAKKKAKKKSPKYTLLGASVRS